MYIKYIIIVMLLICIQMALLIKKVTYKNIQILNLKIITFFVINSSILLCYF